MDKSTEIIIPVLVIGFNRPDIIRQSISKLRESKPLNMYFACDGVRTSKNGEQNLVDEVRFIMENEIDWICEKHYRYNDENKGCEVTESEAITWVLSENEYIIVVEDDIIAPYSFLKFAQELLIKYRNEENIYMISSDNTTPIKMQNNEDYLFSMYGHIWGWATWKRAWNHFNLYVNDFDETISKVDSRKDLSSQDKIKLINLSKKLKNNGVGNSTWDIVWSYIKWRDGGLSIVPRVHLSSNVGVYGLHTQGFTKSHFNKYDEQFEVKMHPKCINRDLFYDNFHYEKHIKQPPYLVNFFKRVINYIKRNCKKSKNY